MYVTIRKAAKMISNISEMPLKYESLRDQVRRGHWPHGVFKISGVKHYLLKKGDVIEYGKTFAGLPKKGRPKK